MSGASRLLTAYAVSGVGAVTPETDLAQVLCSAIDRDRIAVKDGDVLVIASKVVAKAEGRVAAAHSRDEFEHLVDQHSHGLIAQRRFRAGGQDHTVSVVRTAAGTVQAAAGLDQSNADGAVVLHPSDPDASAQRLRERFESYFGARLGVIVSDSASRPWRVGVSDFALGCSGLQALDSQRGRSDGSGRPQAVTVRAVADEIAAAADLVKGAARGLPLAIVRGLAESVQSGADGARGLNRAPAEDWFRHGHIEAVHQALGASGFTEPPSAEGDDDLLVRVSRCLAAARGTAPRTPGQEHWRMRLAGAGARIQITPAGASAPSTAGGHPLVEAAVGLGALIERLLTALRSEDLHARVDHRWAPDGAPAGAELTLELVLEES